MAKKQEYTFFDMSAEERRAYCVSLLQNSPPAGLPSPVYVSSLGFYDSDAKDMSDISVLLIVGSGGKRYLVNERMELLSAGYDEILPYAKKGFRSLLFEVVLDSRRGVIDSGGRTVAEVKYERIYPRSLTHDRDGHTTHEYTDLLMCALPGDRGGTWDVIDVRGTLIFSGLCGVDECEVTRKYKHFVSSQEVGVKYYSERVESLYIYREYDLSDDKHPDCFLEYAFRVSVFDMLLGCAEPEPDGQVEIRAADYPRQLGKLTLRRELAVPLWQFDEE